MYINIKLNYKIYRICKCNFIDYIEYKICKYSLKNFRIKMYYFKALKKSSSKEDS